MLSDIQKYLMDIFCDFPGFLHILVYVQMNLDIDIGFFLFLINIVFCSISFLTNMERNQCVD